MTARDVADKVATYFGGTYDAPTRSYRTIPAPLLAAGLSLVKRGFSKRDDFADYFIGQAPGAMTGAMMIVYVPDDQDRRIALPAVQGRRKVHYAIELHCFVWSKAPYAEDVTDFVYDLGDAIVARIRLDPTLGTGGIETGNFQVGEGSEDGGGSITRHRDQAETTSDTTKAYLLISFEAHAYDVA